jgi:hypothetical protein
MSSSNAIMQYSFLRVFANDNTIDDGELGMLMRLALRDDIVDEHERKVLSSVFGRVSRETVTPEVWESICSFKAENGIP